MTLELFISLAGTVVSLIVTTITFFAKYLKNKKETADKRNAQKRLERLRAEAEKIEKEIDGIDAEMNGEAASDYARLSELDERKNALEERLLEIYGEI